MKSGDFLDKLLDGVGVEWKALEDVASFRRGSFPQPYGNSEWYDGEESMPFVQVVDVSNGGFSLKENTKQRISKLAQVKSVFVEKGTVIVTLQGTIGRVAVTQYDCYIDRTLAIFTNYIQSINKKYFAYQLKKKFDIEKENARGSTLKTITKEEFSKFEIPIPCPENPKKSLEIQAKIVSILDTFTELTAELTARKKQYNYYRDQLLSFEEGEVEWKALGEVYKFQYGMGNTIPTLGGEYPVYGSNGIVGTHNEFNSEDSPVIGHIGAYAGIVNWGAGKHFVTYNGVICKLINKLVHPKYAYYQLLKQDFNSMAKSASHPFVSYDALNKVSVPIPPPAEQARIVAILDKFDALTSSLREGLPREIALRQKQYEHYRDLLLRFPKPEEAPIKGKR